MDVSATDAYPISGGAGDLDADYVAGAVDLLGVLAYGELTTYQSLAVHAFSAPDLAARVALCRYAAADFDHVRRLEGRLAELGCRYGQGFFFSKPLGATGVLAVLRQGTLRG